MKILFKSVISAFVLCVVFTMIPFSAQCRDISREVFRLHILAESDSEADQALKLKVRDRVLRETESIYKNCASLCRAEELTEENLQRIADAAKDEVVKHGYDYSVKAEIKNMYFDTRCYGNVTMPAGKYDAMRITIGSGKGHNWWCVMYPSLCVGSSADYNSFKEKTNGGEFEILTSQGFEFRFKLLEYFEKICSFFS